MFLILLGLVLNVSNVRAMKAQYDNAPPTSFSSLPVQAPQEEQDYPRWISRNIEEPLRLQRDGSNGQDPLVVQNNTPKCPFRLAVGVPLEFLGMGLMQFIFPFLWMTDKAHGSEFLVASAMLLGSPFIIPTIVGFCLNGVGAFISGRKSLFKKMDEYRGTLSPSVLAELCLN